jgi:hypothetical protein
MKMICTVFPQQAVLAEISTSRIEHMAARPTRITACGNDVNNRNAFLVLLGSKG